MHSLLLRLALPCLGSLLAAQSPLTTTFLGNNAGLAGGTICFDLNVTAPSGIVVTGLDVNLQSAANTVGTIEVYTCPVTRVGNQTNPAAWTLVAAGALTAAGGNLPSTVALPEFSLPAGSVGVALKAVGVAHRYTNGNNSYTNPDLTLSTGEASQVAFSTPLINSRTVNCTLRYERRIQTLFAPSAGITGQDGAVHFDIDVTNVGGITVTGMDLILGGNPGTPGQVSVYTCPTGRAGNLNNASAWSLVGTGSVTSNGTVNPSRVVLDRPIPLSFGSVGVTIASTLGHRYTTGNGANQTYTNADLSIVCGEATFPPFSGNLFSPRVANLRLAYQAGLNAPQATRSNFGVGCTSQVASFYEFFGSPASFDLSNRSMTMTPATSGYAVTAGGLFVAPGAGATQLALTDDSEVLTPVLSTAFPYQGGTANQLMVCSNGFVSVATGNGVAFLPNVADLLNRSQTAWFCWHDYNPAIAGSGQVFFEEVGGVAIITWNGVWNFGSNSPAAANTFQFQFDLASGAVKLVWGQMANSGNPYLVGYSPGGPSVNPGNRDLSAALPNGFQISGSDQNLTLNALQRPIPGNHVSLVTGNINPNTLFGAVILGLQQFPAGVSLDPIGMTGCFQYTDGSITLPLFLGGAASQVTTFGIPNAPGLHAYAQSAIYCPGANLNPLGAATSGALDLGIGGY